MFPSNKSNVLSITPDFVNYGYGKTEDDSIFKKLKSAKRIAFVVLATIMVLTGVSLGIIYSLPPKTYTKPVGSYLIAGGYVNRGPFNITEVVELLKSNFTPSFGQLPSVYQGNAVGSMLGNVPIICGGYNGYLTTTNIQNGSSAVDFCISFENSEWSQTHLLNDKRAFSAGVKINSTTIWIVGGSTSTSISDLLDSTEFIVQGKSNGVPGPKLPYELIFSCAVKLSEGQVFVIGGGTSLTYATKKVWIYDPKNGFKRNPGPSLTTGRSYHSCSTLRDGEKTLIIVAGGYGADNEDLDSVEIYDPTENTWQSGPSLPYSVSGSAMTESLDGKGVLLFGGKCIQNKKILELHARDNSWTTLNVSLENGRHAHNVIPLNFGCFLIAGGFIDYALTEVVEFTKNNSIHSFGQLPSPRLGAVGAMFGNAPIICSGNDLLNNVSYDSCISFQNSQWSQSHSMGKKRFNPAGVQINSTTLWILGGNGGIGNTIPWWNDTTDTTEFIIQGQSNAIPGPKLPYAAFGLCAVKLSEQEIFVIGGFYNRRAVWIFNPQKDFARKEGPSMKIGRHGHSCGTLRDGEKTLIIVAGGAYISTTLEEFPLNSVEIYDPTDNTWNEGPPLPYILCESTMGKSPDGKCVLLFGGRSTNDTSTILDTIIGPFEVRILELCAGASWWNIKNTTLTNERRWPTVIPLQ